MRKDEKEPGFVEKLYLLFHEVPDNATRFSKKARSIDVKTDAAVTLFGIKWGSILLSPLIGFGAAYYLNDDVVELYNEVSQSTPVQNIRHNLANRNPQHLSAQQDQAEPKELDCTAPKKLFSNFENPREDKLFGTEIHEGFFKASHNGLKDLPQCAHNFGENAQTDSAKASCANIAATFTQKANNIEPKGNFQWNPNKKHKIFLSDEEVFEMRNCINAELPLSLIHI